MTIKPTIERRRELFERKAKSSSLYLSELLEEMIGRIKVLEDKLEKVLEEK